MPLDISVEDAVLTPVVPAHDDVELLSVLRMERVSDSDGAGRLAGAGCSWLDGRTCADEAGPSPAAASEVSEPKPPSLESWEPAPVAAGAVG